MLTGVGSEVFVTSAFSFSLSRRANVTDNVLNVNVNEQRFWEQLSVLLISLDYILVRGRVVGTPYRHNCSGKDNCSLEQSTVEETCPFVMLTAYTN